MNLDVKIKELINSAANNNKDNIDKKDSTVFEMKQLESQMNKHLQSKQGQKFKKISIFNFDEKKDYNENSFGELVNKEIENKYINKKWHALPLYMKWKLVQEYILDESISDSKIIANIKDAVNKNNIDMITYDHLIHKVINIDITRIL